MNSGGKVFNGAGYLGFDTGSSNNVAVISGTARSGFNPGNLYLGNSDAANQLIVTNGGVVFSGVGFLGLSASSSKNAALVSGHRLRSGAPTAPSMSAMEATATG